MATKCGNCERELKPTAKFCPGCGTPVEPKAKAKAKAAPAPEAMSKPKNEGRPKARAAKDVPPAPEGEREPAGPGAAQKGLAVARAASREAPRLIKGLSSLVSRAGKAVAASPARGKWGKRPTRYTFDIRTEDRRTGIETTGEDMLWVYAEIVCEKPEVRTDLITRDIEFTVEGKHADWVTLGRPQIKGSMKAVRMKAGPPEEDADLTDDEVTVVVTARIDGQEFAGRVDLTLEEEAQLKITILE